MSVSIRTKKNGPLVVEGDFELYDGDGHRMAVEGQRRVLLCRCGKSTSAPLCDAAHNRERAAPPTPAPEASAAAGRRRRKGDLAPDPEMWQWLDEGKKLRAILQDFYGRVYADGRLAPFFHGVTKQRAVEKQYSFLCEKFTGEACYFGDRPRNAHHWMVISNELFDYREELMEECLRRAGMPEPLVARWRRLEEVFRKQIVKSAPVGRKIRGVELPLHGYEPLALDLDFLCDGCAAEVRQGETVHYHRRTGRTYCVRCVPDPSKAEDLLAPSLEGDSAR
ncbi:MAG: CDGSH iron-sulfur domain-containing protein [Myxococcales bacterium]|nr:CDGSH iron-sulfur domain-containing protein [Myxococcales bacterium]